MSDSDVEVQGPGLALFDTDNENGDESSDLDSPRDNRSSDPSFYASILNLGSSTRVTQGGGTRSQVTSPVDLGNPIRRTITSTELTQAGVESGDRIEQSRVSVDRVPLAATSAGSQTAGHSKDSQSSEEGKKSKMQDQEIKDALLDIAISQVL